MKLVDEKMTKQKEGITVIHKGDVVMGDKSGGDMFKNIQHATIINKSAVENSFNNVKAEYGEEVAKALLHIAVFIDRSGNKEAGELF